MELPIKFVKAITRAFSNIVESGCTLKSVRWSK